MTLLRVLIVADLEGIIGLSTLGSEASKNLMSSELNFIVNYISRTTETREITVCDIHNYGLLLEREDFAQEITLIKGIDKLWGCGWNFDFAIMVGFHGKTDSGGLFDHTFRNDFIRLWCPGIDSDMGEVAAFSLWIESKGIPVVLVSGEGNFDDEIKRTSCIIHKVIHTQSIAGQYHTLVEDLKKSMSTIHGPLYFEDTHKVYVEVDNHDKLEIVANENFSIEDGAVVFNNLDCFFGELYPFVDALIKAYFRVAKENYSFANSIKKLNIAKHDYPELNDIFEKPIGLITEYDRNLIKQRLGL